MATNNTTIKALVNLANNYDRFTVYIDNYRQQQQAERANEMIQKEFIETAKLLGIDATASDFYYITSNTGTTCSRLTTEEAVHKFLEEKGYKEEETMETTTSNMCETCVHYNPNEDSLTCQACGEDGISYWKPKGEQTEFIPEVIIPAEYFEEDNKQEEVKMEKKDLATIILNMSRNERLVYVWETVLNITDTCSDLYITKAELAKFLFDNDIIQRSLSKKELKKTNRQELVDILDTAVNNLAKTGHITINKKEDKKEDTIVTQVNTETKEREDAAVEKAKLKLMLKVIKDPESSDETVYKVFNAMLKNETDMTLREFIVSMADDFVKGITAEDVQETVETAQEEVVVTESQAQGNTTEKAEEQVITHQVICTDHGYYDTEYVALKGTAEQCEEYVEDNKGAYDGMGGLTDSLASYEVIPVAAEYNTIEYSKEVAADILKRVILIANNNASHNVISDWMLTSAIAEIVTGHPLKGKDDNGKWTEFYKTFTDEQKENIKALRVQFLRNNGFKPIFNKDKKATSYIIPAKLLVYGRHVWLNAACVYHFISKNSTKPIVYHVSLNGVKRVDTGVITPLDDAGYAKLDSTCKFIQ